MNNESSWINIAPKETLAGAPTASRKHRGPRWPFYLAMISVTIGATGLATTCGIDVQWWTWCFVFGAWGAIAAGETDADSPLNQTLMDKIRGNLDDLNDRADSRRTLLNLGGEIYNSADDWQRMWKAYATVSSDPGHDLLRDLQVYVPPSVGELRVSVCAQASSGANAKIVVTVGETSADVTPLPTSYDWSDEAVISNPGSGWKAVTVTASVTSGGPQVISLAGMVIRTA